MDNTNDNKNFSNSFLKFDDKEQSDDVGKLNKY